LKIGGQLVFLLRIIAYQAAYNSEGKIAGIKLEYQGGMSRNIQIFNCIEV